MGLDKFLKNITHNEMQNEIYYEMYAIWKITLNLFY